MNLQKDGKYTPVQAFAPNSGDTLLGAVTPLNTIGVKLGGDVDITIDGVSIPYTQGEGLFLVAGVTYTFGSSVNVHVMGKLQE